MRLVIFDADGTLVDSLALIHGAMEKTFDQFGMPKIESSSTREIIGLTLDHAIAHLLDRQIDDEIRTMSAAYKEHYLVLQKLPQMQVALYEGIKELVHDLSSRDDMLLAIATGKSRRGVEGLLDAHDFREHFIVSRCADDCPSKPHPAMIDECCEVAGIEKADAIMIGDTSFDMHMAKAAGTKAVGVSWGYHDIPTLEGSGADHIIHHPNELHGVLDNV